MQWRHHLSEPPGVVSTISFLPPANQVWGKVMFLHVSVILFTGGGESAWGGGNLHPIREGGLHRGEGWTQTPPELEKRVVRILQECFLVIIVIISYNLIGYFKALKPRRERM